MRRKWRWRWALSTSSCFLIKLAIYAQHYVHTETALHRSGYSNHWSICMVLMPPCQCSANSVILSPLLVSLLLLWCCQVDSLQYFFLKTWSIYLFQFTWSVVELKRNTQKRTSQCRLILSAFLQPLQTHIRNPPVVSNLSVACSCNMLWLSPSALPLSQ